VVRGLPALLVRQELDIQSRVALGFLSATELPLVVAIAEIGVSSGQLMPETAASLVGAGMASVLLFPITALTLRRIASARRETPSEVATPDKLAEGNPRSGAAP
jgi:hypothetical protein